MRVARGAIRVSARNRAITKPRASELRALNIATVNGPSPAPAK